MHDICVLTARRAFEEAGALQQCALMGQNALREARAELRRPGTRVAGWVAYFPERYGDELLPLALNILQQKPAPAAIFVKRQLLTPRNLGSPRDEAVAESARKAASGLENSAAWNQTAVEV